MMAVSSGSNMRVSNAMPAIRTLLPVIVSVWLAAWAVTATAHAAADAAIFRIFLKDGTSVTSFGEYSRSGDRVIYSMPVGGTPDEPRLQLVWLPATSVDWFRTDKYAASTRYQLYALSRGEEDFRLLSNDVARVLNDIALSTDRKTALAMAEQARQALADWPRAHYGYRQEDVKEIVGLIDEAITDLRATSDANSFELSLRATPMEPVAELEPVLPLPPSREQLQEALHVADVVTHPSERLALLQSVLAMIADPATGLGASEAEGLRRSAERFIQEEVTIDRKYAELSGRLTSSAVRAAERARISAVERVLTQIDKEDEKLGRKRPDTVTALRTSIESKLTDARRLRLLRDQWQVRQSIYKEYQRNVGPQLVALQKSQTSLESIRRLDGPKPKDLQALQYRLSGGSARLERMPIPDELRTAHDLLVGAWRFAEAAVRSRNEAATAGNLGMAWEASSAAAGALMLLSRAQIEIQTLLEPPRIQ